MTRFQKQVLLKEEERQKEEAQEEHGKGGNTNPSGALNAKNPNVSGISQSETVRYKNDNEFETDNQVEVIE